MNKPIGDIELIRRALPHRYPFLLVDRVVEFEADKRITAIKNITVNEPQFTGHFPRLPVMPGVLLLEALAQTSGLLIFMSSGLEQLPENDYMLLAGIDSCRFRRMVVPGDQVFLHAELQRTMRNLLRFTTRAEVDGQVVCEARITSVHQQA